MHLTNGKTKPLGPFLFAFLVTIHSAFFTTAVRAEALPLSIQHRVISVVTNPDEGIATVTLALILQYSGTDPLTGVSLTFDPLFSMSPQEARSVTSVDDLNGGEPLTMIGSIILFSEMMERNPDLTVTLPWELSYVNDQFASQTVLITSEPSFAQQPF